MFTGDARRQRLPVEQYMLVCVCVFMGMGACLCVLVCVCVGVSLYIDAYVWMWEQGPGISRDPEPVAIPPAAPQNDQGRKPMGSLENKAEGVAGSVCLSVFQSKR